MFPWGQPVPLKGQFSPQMRLSPVQRNRTCPRYCFHLPQGFHRAAGVGLPFTKRVDFSMVWYRSSPVLCAGRYPAGISSSTQCQHSVLSSTSSGTSEEMFFFSLGLEDNVGEVGADSEHPSPSVGSGEVFSFPVPLSGTRQPNCLSHLRGPAQSVCSP